MDIEKLKKLYNQLKTHEQHILQIASLVNESLPQKELVKIIQSCDVLFRNQSQPITQMAAKDAIKKLKKKGFFKDEESSPIIASDIGPLVLIHFCSSNPDLAHYRRVINRELPKREKQIYSYQVPQFDFDRMFRELRTAFFLKENEEVLRIIDEIKDIFEFDIEDDDDVSKLFARLLAPLITSHINEAGPFIDRIPGQYFFRSLVSIMDILISSLLPLLPFSTYLQQKLSGTDNTFFATLLADCYFFIGRFDDFGELASRYKIYNSGYTRASIAFYRGKLEEAKQLFSAEIEKAKGGKRIKNYCPPLMHGFNFCMTMVMTDAIDSPLFDGAVNKGIQEKNDGRPYLIFKAYKLALQGDKEGAWKQVDKSFNTSTMGSFSLFSFPLIVLLLQLQDDNRYRFLTSSLREWGETARKSGYTPLAFLYYTIITRVDKEFSPDREEKELLDSFRGYYIDLTTFAAEEEGWKKALQVLKNIARSTAGKESGAKQGSERLVWFVDCFPGGMQCNPRE